MPKKVYVEVSCMVPITTKEGWMKFFNNTDDPKLYVVDLHPAWCGGCSIMN